MPARWTTPRPVITALCLSLGLGACQKGNAPSAAAPVPASSSIATSKATSAAPPTSAASATAASPASDNAPVAFAGAYELAVRRAFEGRSWADALVLLEAPAYLLPLEKTLRAASKRPGTEGAAARVLIAAIDRGWSLVRRFSEWKENAPIAGPFACEARLHAYAFASRALKLASDSKKDAQARQRAVLSAFSGIQLPPRGAARVLCQQRFLKGCEGGPSTAGLEYVRSLRGQLDAVLMRGLRQCPPKHALARLLEPIVSKEELLGGIPARPDGRANFDEMGLVPFSNLDF